MKTLNSIRYIVRLLSRKARRKFLFSILVQSSLALLDLAGVFLLGVVTIILTRNTVPDFLYVVIPTFPSDIQAAVGLMILLATAFFLARGFLAPFLFRLMGNSIAKTSADKSIEMTRLFFRQDLGTVESQKTQERIYSLGPTVLSVINEGIGATSILVSEAFLMSIMVAALIFVNPTLSAISFLYFLLVLILMQRAISKRQSFSRGVVIQKSVAAADAFMEIFNNYREIFVAEKIDFYISEYAENRRTESKYSWNLQFLNLLPKYLFEVAFFLGASLIFVTVQALDQGADGLVQITIFVASGSRIMPSLLRLQASLSTIRNLDTHIDRMKELTDSMSRPISSPSISTNQGDAIQVDKLLFQRKVTDEWNLKIDFLNIEIGEKIALVGPSGSGKTTLVELLLGLLRPSSGGIYIGSKGSNLEIDESQLKFSYVPQSISLLNRTIRENIALGIPASEINELQILEALNLAGASDFVAKLPNGIHTVVGERAAFLSGGERQRLGLARALYSKPDILFLDEATSALDSSTEAHIEGMLQSLPGDLTTITIAHRLSTVQDANRVLYLENGRILADGTFEQIRKQIPNFDVQAKLMGL
jgi:ABC-type multidrug transport system fused ATPase/permease subunit